MQAAAAVGKLVRPRARRVSREPLSLFPDTPRWCTRCRQNLPRDAFAKAAGVRDGLETRCKQCNAERRNAAQAAHSKRRRKYALEPEVFEAMVAACGNRCAICDRDMGQGIGCNVDHCHATGRVRGLLCRLCNTALGQAGDSPARLRAMADYIERHAGKAP